MDSNYIKTIIEHHFKFLLKTRQELSECIEETGLFSDRSNLVGFIKEGGYQLVYKDWQALFNLSVDDELRKILLDFKSRQNVGVKWSYVDRAIVILSLYYHYPSICRPIIMYGFIRELLVNKIVLV